MPPAKRKRGQELEGCSCSHVPPIRSEAARQVAIAFGLPIDARRPTRARPLPFPGGQGISLPAPGQIMLITGASGAGKSSLLKVLLARAARLPVEERPGLLRVDRLRLPARPCVDQVGGDLHQALSLLSQVGLGEACTYLRLPRELSDGQRWRLRLAVAINQALRQATPALLAADEFGAVLDRITASVVARAVRRLVDRSGARLSAILATSHDDLVPALLPDVVVRCDFVGVEVQAQPVSTRPPAAG